MTDTIAPATDATPVPHAVTDQPTPAQTEVQDFQRQAGNIKPGTAAADKSVHEMFGTPEIHDRVGHGQATHPQPTTEQVVRDLKDHAAGAGQFVVSAGVGAGQSLVDLKDHVVGAAQTVIAAPGQAYDKAPGVAASVSEMATNGVNAVMDHPAEAAATAAKAIVDAHVAVGTAVIGAAQTVGQTIIDHPVQAAVIAGAVVAEVCTLGTSTPASVTAIAAAGTALATHDVWNAGSAVSRDADAIGPMFHPSTATPGQTQAAKDAVAKDTGTAVVSVASVALGNAFLKVGAGFEKGAEVAGHAAEAVADAGKVATVTADATVATPAAAVTADVQAVEVGAAAGAATGTAGANAAQRVFKAVDVVHGVYDKAATVDSLANVGGHGGPTPSAADERARHATFPAK